MHIVYFGTEIIITRNRYYHVIYFELVLFWSFHPIFESKIDHPRNYFSFYNNQISSETNLVFILISSGYQNVFMSCMNGLRENKKGIG